MAQHLWLSRRAQLLQDSTADDGVGMRERYQQFGLAIRYKATNDRGFHTCLNQLLKLRAEKRRSEIGFESQQQKKAQQERREAGEKRRQELHQYAVLLAEAKVDHQMILNSNVRLDQIVAAKPEIAREEVKKAA